MMIDDISIRAATADDAAKILQVYAPYVEKTAITFEYSVPELEEFRSRIVRILEKYPYIVAEQDSRILGFAYAGAFVGRAAYDWSVETTIYVDEARRLHGLGKRLYAALEDILFLQGILNLNACIGYPETEDRYLTKNSAQFHHHMGYQMVGEFHRCGYKFGKWYNMIWMEKIIGEHMDDQPAVKPFPAVKGSLNFNKY